MVNNVLHDIQQKLKAPKGQFNSLAKYNFRSCEDIVEAVKPLIPEGYSLVMSDKAVLLGTHLYIKAKVGLIGGGGKIMVNGYAREALNKKGMDEGQMTGTASSYARKYALNGLFAIDDTKDADSNEYKAEVNIKAAVKEPLIDKLKQAVGKKNTKSALEAWESLAVVKEARVALFKESSSNAKLLDDAIKYRYEALND